MIYFLTGVVCFAVGYGIRYLQGSGTLKKIEAELDKGYTSATQLVSAVRQHL